jgi:hypothetical protein
VNRPLLSVCFRLAVRVRRQSRDLRRLERAYRVAVDENEVLQGRVEGWKERCLALYLAAEDEPRELVMRHYQTLDRLDVRENP